VASNSSGPAASTTAPLASGVAAVGTATTYARADHIHPLASQVIGDNRLINGDMRIDQRNNGASGTANGYTVDRWQYSGTAANKGTWSRVTGGVSLLSLGFGYSLSFVSSSAYTAAAGEGFTFFQPIEADVIADFAWGTSQAQPVTLSFWVNSTLTGTFSGAIRNRPAPATRSYPFSFSIPVAGAWTKIVVTIPGDTAGAWVLQGNAAGLDVLFDLGSGATLRGPANAWAATNYIGVTGAVSVVATNGANFFVTGVKLEIGSVATPYNRQSLTKSLADCQRYYQTLVGVILGGYNTAGNSMWSTISYSSMRAVPTATPNGQTYSNASGFTPQTIQTNSVQTTIIITATGVGYGQSNIVLNAEL
jgi:hypothetical protein